LTRRTSGTRAWVYTYKMSFDNRPPVIYALWKFSRGYNLGIAFLSYKNAD